ncbi:hypothetical protein LX36DRAFT_715324 [Colletotrichum falcatum]|nr:hypothetical protein LX36DRAFT_715324 [Colletotrichum falcatum]
MAVRSVPSPSGNLVQANCYVSWIGLLISALFLALRLVHRYCSKGLGWDDLFALLSWVFSAATQALMLCAIALETMCYHHDDISPKNFNIYSVLSYVAAPMFALSIGCAQMSVLFSYRRLASTDWAFKVAIISSMVVVSAATVTMTALFLARPRNPSLNVIVLAIVVASFNIVIDIVLVVLPILRVFNIQMPPGKKALVLGFFSLGLITASVSVVRLVLLQQLRDSSDFTWDAALANMISYVNGHRQPQDALTDNSFLGVNLHVIFACLPAVRKFFRDKCPSTGPVNPSHGEVRPLSPHNSGQARLLPRDVELGQVPSTPNTDNGSTKELLQAP